jgi:hypothetical protein
MAGQAREIVLDGEFAVSDDRGVTHIDDRQDAIAGRRPKSDQAGTAPRWSRPNSVCSSRSPAALPRSGTRSIKQP